MDELFGKVELFAHGGTAQIDGTIKAIDGFVETSGKNLNVESTAKIETSKWLLDPDNMIIQSTGGDVLTGESVSATAIQNALSTADIELQATTNIAVNENITWSTDKQLKLSADSINVNKTIENTNTTNGGVFFNAANTNNKVIFNATDGKVIIHNINQLQWVNQALQGKYELGSNIDATVTSGWNGGKGWIPIGVIAVVGMDATPANPFKGNFDGLGHSISNLYINDNMKSGAGLFGATNGATIKNINLTTVNIRANRIIGGLVGQSVASTIQNASVSGTIKGGDMLGGLVGTSGLVSSISNSYSTASVIDGSGSDRGGLVGINSGGSKIENSYATGSVSGGNTLGGLVGQNDASTIKNSYATGGVAGSTNVVGGLVGSTLGTSVIENSYASSAGAISGPVGNLGGLVGYSYGGTITNSYYDNQANAIAMDDSVARGKTKAEIVTLIGGTGAGAIWGINGSQVSGYTTDTITLPFLKNVTKFDNTLFQSGFGDSTNPYTITNWTQLQNINYNTTTLGKYFTLSNNLNSTTADYASLASSSANGGEGWIPIGREWGGEFIGNFDGLNHEISGLYINRPTKDYQGLFASTKDSTISNVGITDINFIIKGHSGGLVGTAESSTTINNSYATGEITGTSQMIGGLVGQTNTSTINNSYAGVNIVSQDVTLGGLVGYHSTSSTINNSYATGSISGAKGISGGLVGSNNSASTINGSYATGAVSGSDYMIGGLVGRNSGSTINNSYATGSVSGISQSTNGNSVGGLVGSNSNSSSINNSYATGKVSAFYTAAAKGLVGNNSGATVNNSFWDITTTEQATSNGGTGLTTQQMSYGKIFETAGWTIVIDNTLTSSAPIRKFDTGTNAYIWAIAELKLSSTLDDKSTTYNGASQNLSSFYTNIFGDEYSFLNPDYKFQVSADDVTGYKDAGTYENIKAVKAETTNDFLVILNPENTGKLVINQKNVGISNSKIYDGNVDFNSNFVLKNTDIVSGDTVNVSSGAATVASKNVGTYTSFITNTLTLDNANYKINSSDISSGITKANATVTANSDSKVYTGLTQTVNGFTASGLVNGETTSVLDAVSASTSGLNAGTYTATASGTDENYNLTFANGTLTIVKANATVTANSDTTKVYTGLTQSVTGFTATGLVNGETIAELSGVTATGSGLNAGTYTATASGTDKNYNLIFVNGNLTITKADAIVTANTASKVYNGVSQNVNGFTASGLVGSDTVSVLTGVNGDSASGTNVGTYNTALTGTDGNYTLSFVNGNLTITPKAITITGITAENKVYDGTTNATLNKASASYVGIIGTDNLSVATANGVFENKEVGTAKTVNISNLALGGTAAGNYNLTSTTATTTANITAVPTPPTPDPVVPTPEPKTEPKVPENIISAAENSVIPPIVRLPNTNVPLASTSNLGAGNANPTSNVNVVSQPLSNQSSQSVSLGQLQQSQTNESGPQGTADIRVPASANSQIILVNGGVNLPDGVEQEFYVSANQNNENNTNNESKEK